MAKPEEELSVSAGAVRDATGLTNRQLSDWDARGVTSSSRDGNRSWRRYTPREIFALMVCAELRRRFGTPVERVRFVRDFMLQEGADHYQVAIEMMAKLGVNVWLMTDFERQFVMDTELEFADMWKWGAFGGETPAYAFLLLNPLVNKLLACLKEPVHLPNHGRGYELVHAVQDATTVRGPEEFKALQLIRSGEYESVEVCLRNGTISRFRLTDHADPSLPIEQLVGTAEFQSMLITLRNGKVVTVGRETVITP